MTTRKFASSGTHPRSRTNSRRSTEDQIAKEQGKTLLKDTNIELVGRADKMSKARGNVINPDDVVNEYGADALRLYEMFMGPLEATKPWSMRGVEGVYRFLNRVWRLIIDDRHENVKLLEAVQDVEPDKETQRILHRDDQARDRRSGHDVVQHRDLRDDGVDQSPDQANRASQRACCKTFVLLLSPFAPHLAEELWHALGARRHAGL